MRDVALVCSYYSIFHFCHCKSGYGRCFCVCPAGSQSLLCGGQRQCNHSIKLELILFPSLTPEPANRAVGRLHVSPSPPMPTRLQNIPCHTRGTALKKTWIAKETGGIHVLSAGTATTSVHPFPFRSLLPNTHQLASKMQHDRMNELQHKRAGALDGSSPPKRALTVHHLISLH